jgi:hypothetical protein
MMHRWHIQCFGVCYISRNSQCSLNGLNEETVNSPKSTGRREADKSIQLQTTTFIQEKGKCFKDHHHRFEWWEDGAGEDYSQV